MSAIQLDHSTTVASFNGDYDEILGTSVTFKVSDKEDVKGLIDVTFNYGAYRLLITSDEARHWINALGRMINIADAH